MEHKPVNTDPKSDHSDEMIQPWEWPLMDSELPSDDTTNALGYQANWYQKQEEVPAVEEVEPEQQPLTLEEIEAVRQAAYEDGFNEGREAGFANGLEEGRLQGLQEGHEQGSAQGQAEGLALGQSLIDEQVTSWKLLAEKLAHPLAELDVQTEQQLVYMAMRLARSLILHEVQTSADLLLGSLKQAVSLLPCAEEGIQLTLHPDDMDRIREVFGAEECQRRGWSLVADPTLNPGDLQLASRTSSIDWLLEERIDNLLRNFLRTNARQEPTPPTPSHPESAE